MKTVLCASALLLSLFPSSRLFALETPDGPAVPIVAVHLGRTVGPELIEETARALDAPVLKGRELCERLGLVGAVEDRSVASATLQFSRASDHFFAGRPDQARTGFEQIVQSARPGPALASNSAHREIVFKSYLFLAMIGRAEDDSLAADRALLAAASLFAELAPSPVDFPPWLCARYQETRQREARRLGKIVLHAPPGCSLILSGRDLGKGPEFPGIEPGVYGARAVCRGQESPAQGLVMSGQTLVYRPLLLDHGRIAADSGEFVIRPEKAASAAEITEDLLAVARAGDWPRLIALVGADAGFELWLVDAANGGVVRRASAVSTDRQAIAAAAEKLLQDPNRAPGSRRSPELRAWYKDGAAWSLIGGGAALVAAGIAIGRVFGTPSAEEAWSYALMAGGSALAGTGVVLFFFPGRDAGGADAKGRFAAAFGLAARGTF